MVRDQENAWARATRTEQDREGALWVDDGGGARGCWVGLVVQGGLARLGAFLLAVAFAFIVWERAAVFGSLLCGWV